MDGKLTAIETAELSRFRFITKLEHESSAISVAHLINEKQMQDFLNDVKVEVKAPDLRVAASVFTKRFAFVVVIYLYSLSSWNKRLHFSKESLFLQSNEKQGNWLPEYYLKDYSVEEFLTGDRDKWRDEGLTYLFREIIHPVLEVVAKTGKVSPYTLWENIALYIFWLYENVLGDELSDDYNYVVNNAPGRLFGPFHLNPLKRYKSEQTYIEELDDVVRIRKTCCFSYELGEKRTYCKTCPLYCKQFNTGKRNRNE